ncbi:MAG: response regulator transcription factor [Planctomycetes bacterium]|nr:response regulator transcription factor [Planctomycetota bacterium]
MTTIILADDHPVVRHGLKALLEAEADFQVVGECGDGLEAVRLAERLKPNVLVVDVMMPGVTGLEVARQVTERLPETRVVILSMHANEAYVLEALRNGATGYVLKDSGGASLVEAVRAVAAGRRYLSPPLTERAVEAYAQKAKGADVDAFETLTTREREVLHLAAQGLTNPEIGRRLFISARTVEVHRANVMRKLGLKGQTELVRFAVGRGIVGQV